MVLFCQLDVTGRTETEPVAATLVLNLIHYVADWRPKLRRTAVYAGESEGKSYLESVGITAASYDGGILSSNQVLIWGPNAGWTPGDRATAASDWIKAGGNLLAIAID